MDATRLSTFWDATELRAQSRAESTPIERTVARICREAGARVRFNANVGAAERRIEVLAQDLPFFGGAQLAVDVTLRSVLSATGEPHPHTAEVDGVLLLRARQDKERTYPELIGTGRCMLVVVAIETGGRWSDGFIRQLAFAKAREVPKYLRWPTILAWERRWTRMLSTSCSLSFTSSLVEPESQCSTWCKTDGEAPQLTDLFAYDLRYLALGVT